MATIAEIKQRTQTETPLLLFNCELSNGETRRWCTHAVTVAGAAYESRIRQHNLFELRALGEDGADGLGRLTVRLADLDGTLVQLNQAVGFKGAKLRVEFLFFDLRGDVAATDPVTVFLGTANAPEEITESDIRLSFVNRLNMQRNYLPALRIQRRCSWSFPATAEQRTAAADSSDTYQRWNRCGYSPEVPNGAGNLNGTEPYTSCDYSRTQCEQRGMFRQDELGRETRRFGGMDFVPANILVRSFGEAGSHTSYTQENEARFNDVVPLVYGTAWYFPPVIFARNDGNLTHLEILLGSGVIEGIHKVIANDVEIPSGTSGAANAATGWYNLVSTGKRTGEFNTDFSDATGQPLGDPYGSMAVLSLVVPNQIVQGGRLPRVQVLVDGLQLPVYDESGAGLLPRFTNNPAWVLLDILRRSGWQSEELDLSSFARVASLCEEPVGVLNSQGQPVQRPKRQCNLVIRKRTSAADLLRGIGAGAGMTLAFGSGGRLIVRLEATLAAQQPVKPTGSNSVAQLADGWPAYEFGDGTDGWSDILRRTNGEPSLRFWSRTTAELPNRYSVEFQDEMNVYQQDSLSLVDSDDVARAGQEISATLPALGLANYRQAAEVIGIRLRKTLYGNLFAEFETSCRGLGLSPGDLITLTYPRLGLSRQPFRIVKLAPGVNFGSVAITAQVHHDEWYTDPVIDAYGGSGSTGRFELGSPRPLLGGTFDSGGQMQWTLQTVDIDGEYHTARVQAGFTEPRTPGNSRLRAPIIGATPVSAVGGSLAGGQQLYYAVSGIDENGVEGPLSPWVTLALPSSRDDYSVQLRGLSFGPGAAGYRVYRGHSAQALLLVSESASVAEAFLDSGLDATLQGPADYNFDHANFYWRWETIPATGATSWSANSIESDTLNVAPDAYRGQLVRLVRGTGAGQERVIATHTATSFTLQNPWSMQPDGTTQFAVVEASWKLAATTRTSPATWDLPFRAGASVHVLGRAANVRNLEDPYENAIQTRWQLVAGTGAENGIPRKPNFTVTTQGRGTLDISRITFPTLANTANITSGTVGVHYVDELDPSSAVTLAAGLAIDTEDLPLGPLAVEVGNLLQIDGEIVVVYSYDAEQQRAQVSRGEKSTTAAAHEAGATVFRLKRKAVILPFAPGFYGSPGSEDYLHTITLPSARVAEVDLFVSNRLGSSETANVVFTGEEEQGLRTYVGGQFTLSVQGLLGLQDDAALPVVLDQAYAVRRVYGFLSQAPSASPVEFRINVGGEPYVTLTVPAGSTTSEPVSGFGRPPLPAGGRLTVDITNVSGDPAEFPGRDLTVVVEV